MISKEQFERIKADAENAQASVERARGALDQLTTRLRDEFDCKDLKDARRKLAELEEERDRAEAALKKEIEAYKEKWKDARL